MKKIFAVSCVVLIAGYGLLLLWPIPRIDPAQSHFSIACNNNATDAGSMGGFGEIAGKYISMSSKNGINSRNSGYVVSDETWDVVSKVICNDPATFSGRTSIQNAQALYQTVHSKLGDLQVTEAYSKPANYEVVMTSPVYDPSWAVYILKVIGLLGLVALVFVFTR